MRPLVSIIIPVYNDADRLKTCLTALENQTYPKSDYEIIVVDNNSEEDIKSVVEQYSQAKLAHESQRGSYAARNKGLSIAKGKILAFTDSDCIPASNWVETGVKQFLQTPRCGLVAGRINLFFKEPGHPTAVELYDSMKFLNQKNYVEKVHFGATANMFTSKEVFDAVGLFNANLKSGGDQEWGERVFAAGYAQIYADDVCIAHPARSELKELKHKVIRITEGHYNLSTRNQEDIVAFFKELPRDIKPPVKGIIQIFLDENIKGIGQKTALSYVVLSLRYTRAWKKIQLYFQSQNKKASQG